jgi:hypothetical protein
MVAHLSFPVTPDDTRHRQNVTDNAEIARPAFTELVNLLRQQDDVAGLRTLHQKGAETGNPDTLYALDVLGGPHRRSGTSPSSRTGGRTAARWTPTRRVDRLHRAARPVRDRRVRRERQCPGPHLARRPAARLARTRAPAK